MLFLSGLLWRRGFSAAVLLVGIISAAVATIGPLYARAAAESTLTDELRAAGADAGLAFTASSNTGNGRALADTVRAIGSADRVGGYGRPITGESTYATAKGAADSASSPTTLATRSGQCEHVVIVSGRCPTRSGDLLVPAAATDGAPHWHLGERLSVRQGVVDSEGLLDGAPIDTGVVVGSYRPRDFTEAYWFGLPFFPSGYGPAVTSALKVGLDAIFTTPGTFAAAPAPPPGVFIGVSKDVEVDVPLDPVRVRLDDVARVRRDVAAVARSFPRRTATLATPALRTELPAVLDRAVAQRRDVDHATLVVVLELAVLALLVLFQVVGGAVEARGDEIALAKLRGLPPWRTVVFALGEPLTLLAAAVPLGFAAGYGITRALSSSVLVGATPVAVRLGVVWALAAALAGGVTAAALGAARTLTRPVLEQWRGTSPARPGRRWAVAAQLAVGVAAIVTVAVLRGPESADPGAVSLLAPALLVAAVALLGVRLLPLVARLGLRPTRASTRLAAFLALRQTVRRPGGLRLAVLLAVAIGLAGFAVCGEAVAAANRSARAQTELGAARQVSVLYEPSHDPQTIVDRVDADGRWAAAVARWSPDGGPGGVATVTSPVLGVEPSRLAAVAYDVRGQMSPSTISRSLTATDSVASVTVRGTSLSATLLTSELTGDSPTLDFQVRQQNQGVVTVGAGTLRPGRHTYTARVDCAAGCTLSGLVFDRSITAEPTSGGTVRLDGMSSDGALLPVRLVTHAWRAGAIGYGTSVSTRAQDGGLLVRFRSTGGGSPVLGYADRPAVVPVVATSSATTTPASTGAVDDFSGAQLNFRVVRRASPLPTVLDDGLLVDLESLRKALPNFAHESAWTVWLGPDAPADALRRLERAGLLVQNVRSESARVATLARQGPALGLLLLLVCAVAAAVLAVGGTAVSLLADARRRMFEMAALRVIGVSQRVLRRSAVAEQLLLLGAALVLGLPAGYAAAALVLPVVPEFADSTPVVLRYDPPLPLVLACGAAFAVLLALTAVIAGRALARAAVPARLRETAR